MACIMINKERCFTVKEAAKLLGVSTATVKRRIKSKELITEERIGRRGLELVIPQRALNLEDHELRSYHKPAYSF